MNDICAFSYVCHRFDALNMQNNQVINAHGAGVYLESVVKMYIEPIQFALHSLNIPHAIVFPRPRLCSSIHVCTSLLYLSNNMIEIL